MSVLHGRVARKAALVRQANDQIRALSEKSGRDKPLVGLICECSRRDCLAPIAVPPDDYERLREDERYFLVAPGHVWDRKSDRVVVQTDDYWVVSREV